MSDGEKHDPTVWNEVWSSNPGDYYADTLSVSPDGTLKFHAAGRVICKPSVRALVLELWPEIQPKEPRADTEGDASPAPPEGIAHEWRFDTIIGHYRCNRCFARDDGSHGPTCPKAMFTDPPVQP